MPVITLDTEFSFDLAAIGDEDLERELRRRTELFRAIEDDLREKFQPDIGDFSTADIKQELRQRREEEARYWIHEAYAMLAEGRDQEAMELIFSELPSGLAPPSHERAIADLISGRKASIHVRN